jgi:hypothetical protein
VAGRRQIDDGQPAVTEAQASVDVDPLIVRAAVTQPARHAQQLIEIHALAEAGVVENSGNTAHQRNT